jgi:hypothetical protein
MASIASSVMLFWVLLTSSEASTDPIAHLSRGHTTSALALNGIIAKGDNRDVMVRFQASIKRERQLLAEKARLRIPPAGDHKNRLRYFEAVRKNREEYQKVREETWDLYKTIHGHK